jgi:hypothetical protein
VSSSWARTVIRNGLGRAKGPPNRVAGGYNFCSCASAFKNSFSATIPAAIAVFCDLKGLSRNRASSGRSLRIISHCDALGASSVVTTRNPFVGAVMVWVGVKVSAWPLGNVVGAPGFLRLGRHLPSQMWLETFGQPNHPCAV